ncbi:MAG: DNA-directed RNA polymerase subunit omega [Deltaproteobacteria bacterium]|nr:DNA-directed RNA polymerase subunit omega [Deltaproteobacteria bacterium]
MARITVEDCLRNIENRFILVHMASQRTRQLLKGASPLVAAPENREVVQSLREIAAGKVRLTEATITRLQERDILDAKS